MTVLSFRMGERLRFYLRDVGECLATSRWRGCGRPGSKSLAPPRPGEVAVRQPPAPRPRRSPFRLLALFVPAFSVLVTRMFLVGGNGALLLTLSTGAWRSAHPN